MSTEILKQKKNTKMERFVTDAVDEKMRDYSKEPAIIKQNKKAIATLTKYGLPKELQNKATKK